PRVEIYSGRACGRRADSRVLPIPVSGRVPNLSTAGPVSNRNLDTIRGNRIRRGSGSTPAPRISECPPDKIALVAPVGARSRCRRSGGTLLRENSPTGGGWPGAILCRIRHPVVWVDSMLSLPLLHPQRHDDDARTAGSGSGFRMDGVLASETGR